jgi:hypothetical protein
MLMRRTDDELFLFEEQFWSGIDLAQLYREGNQAVADGQLAHRCGESFSEPALKSFRAYPSSHIWMLTRY